MQIQIDERVCKGCSLCIHYCPRDVLEMTDRRNQKGYNVVGVRNLAECTGCRLCEISCPDLAIYVEVER